MITVTEINEINTGCPSEWLGLTDYDERIYIRYRNGKLTVHLSKESDKADKDLLLNGATFLIYTSNPDTDSLMTFGELKIMTGGIISFQENP